jgi:hypothetical protein
MHQEGDEAQKQALYKRPAEKVLRELLSDIRLAGCQHFGFKEYKDSHGNRLFAGDSNGSVSFQLAQIRVGADKVPVSLVIYMGATYIKRGILIRLVTEPLDCKEITSTLVHMRNLPLIGRPSAGASQWGAWKSVLLGSQTPLEGVHTVQFAYGLSFAHVAIAVRQLNFKDKSVFHAFRLTQQHKSKKQRIGKAQPMSRLTHVGGGRWIVPTAGPDLVFEVFGHTMS